MYKRKALREVIRTALDCPTHFKKPTIIENDKDFSLGKNPLVICSQCVFEMRLALDLKAEEEIPSSFKLAQKFKK